MIRANIPENRREPMTNLLFSICLLAGLVATADADARSHDPDKRTVRGITISTHGGGRDWGTDVIVPTLADIRSVGANWVSIHPYARIHAEGSVTFRPIDPQDPPAYLTRPIEEAHRQGINICIKPHIAYWGSPFSWRGEITFDREEAWQRFWRDYRRWILALAAVCHDADGFVVGTELDQTLRFKKEWRELIAEVRELTDAPLTYAANWTDYQNVPFWDALDVVGIQGYFPLTDSPEPTAVEIQTGWDRLTAELRTYAHIHNRNILFTELGYSESYTAAAEPWIPRLDGPGARPLQETCLRIALQAIDTEPAIVGALLWKWFPKPNSGRGNFILDTPRIRRLLTSTWLP